MRKHEGSLGPSEPPTVSIIIPTYNRAKFLDRLVQTLVDQNYPANRFEIVVIDDGSHDDTAKTLQRLSTRFPSRLTWKSQPNGGPATARNVGATVAQGDLFYFVDDDCLPDPGWLQHAMSIFQRYPPHTALTSGFSAANPDEPLMWYFLQQSEMVLAGDEPREPTPCAEILPGNFLVSREDFEISGGYDHGQRIGESVEMSRRLLTAGINLLFIPELRIPHLVEHRQTPADYFNYYAYTGAGNCRRELQRNPKEAWRQFARITCTAPLIPLKLVKKFIAYRKTPFDLHWQFRFVRMDWAGLWGYRFGYWRQFLRSD